VRRDRPHRTGRGPCGVLLLVLAVFLLGGCGEPPREDLRFGLSSMPANLDPRFATDAASTRVNRLLYGRLVDFDERSMPVPALAAWERLAPTHYRFVLREGERRFPDSERLTARDVAATYAYILDPANASPHRTALALIERVEVLDEDTVDFHLVRPDPLFPAYLVIGILPARLIAEGHPFHRQPVGSGPFAFVDWPEEGRLRLLRRNDGMPLEFLRVSDPTVRVLKLMRGEIDMLQSDLPPELVRYLAAQEGLRVERGQGSNFTYLGFNLRDPVVARPEVRRAIAHAIDREAIIRYVLSDAARTAEALLPPTHWAGGEALEAYPHDPERARALLAEAGYGPDRPVRISYKTSSDPFRVRLATIIQRQLGEVGIEVDLRSYDWGTFYADIRSGRFQMFSLSWVGIKTPDIFRYAFHSRSVPPAGANRGWFVNTAADGLIEAAEGAQELEAQAAYYRELQYLLLEELPYIPLWYEDHVFVARTGIEGYRLAVDGNYDALAHVRLSSGF
jgi:peptide/nickel transport system substrate-binding protein